MSVNKVFLIGNLGRDPELRQAGSSDVCSFPIATSEKYKDREGDWVERTEWHRVVVWGKTATACAEHLQKGSQVCVEGKIQSRKWEDSDGNERVAFEIIAINVQFLDGRAGKDSEREEETPRRAPPGKTDRGRSASNEQNRDARPSRREPAPRKGGATGFDDMPDDIPF
jgi:single-strand DNA-binding protein